MRAIAERYYHRWFFRHSFVFRHEGSSSRERRTDCEFKRYDSFQELPNTVVVDIASDSSVSQMEMGKRELDEHATLWVAFVAGRVATTVYTREGRYFHHWFLELQPEDIVVFRLVTRQEYRGRGLAPSLIRHAIHETVKPPGHAYIDCRTYNKPSIRCIEKAGFTRIARKRSIKRDWALYG